MTLSTLGEETLRSRLLGEQISGDLSLTNADVPTATSSSSHVTDPPAACLLWLGTLMRCRKILEIRSRRVEMRIEIHFTGTTDVPYLTNRM